MEREIILTADGSHTIRTIATDLTYHSRHGALQESLHVFIRTGLEYWLGIQGPETQSVRIFEMGFGTGLNALLSFRFAREKGLRIHYHTVEPFPLSGPEARSLNYSSQLNDPDLQPVFESMHDANWETDALITPEFILFKQKATIQEAILPGSFDIIYYDAFAPSAQPELWSADIFSRLHEKLSSGGLLVTYCSKGDVKRALRAAGFTVKRIPGPKYKRQILRASKDHSKE